SVPTARRVALPRAPRPALSPYTTLFRSRRGAGRRLREQVADVDGVKAVVLATEFAGDRGHAIVLRGRQRLAFAQAQQHLFDPLRSEEHTLNSSHVKISYAVFCLKKKKRQ